MAKGKEAKSKEEGYDIMGCTRQCIAIKMLVLGVLVLLNAKLGWVNWAYFIGILLALKGVLLLMFPKCPCRK